jgi:hypothetical protein
LSWWRTIVHLAGGHGLLQDQGYGLGVANGLTLLDPLLLREPPVELGEPEALPSAFAPQRVREVFGKLGGEVIRIVAREPLFEGFEGRLMARSASSRLLRGSANRRVAYVSRSDGKAVESLS